MVAIVKSITEKIADLLLLTTYKKFNLKKKKKNVKLSGLVFFF